VTPTCGRGGLLLLLPLQRRARTPRRPRRQTRTLGDTPAATPPFAAERDEPGPRPGLIAVKQPLAATWRTRRRALSPTRRADVGAPERQRYAAHPVTVDVIQRL
jgi:hypothetical protein